MNNSIKEDYCSFEVSKLLKDKGFWIVDDEIIRRAWIYVPNNTWSFTTFGREEMDSYNEWALVRRGIEGHIPSHYKNNIALAPTHDLAIKWIRENFGIHIHIEYIDDILLFLYVITTIKTNTIEKDEAKYNSPEEAVEAALLHTLKELI